MDERPGLALQNESLNCIFLLFSLRKINQLLLSAFKRVIPNKLLVRGTSLTHEVIRSLSPIVRYKRLRMSMNVTTEATEEINAMIALAPKDMPRPIL